MTDLLFSYEGRIGIGRFWFGMLMCILTALAMALVLGFAAGLVVAIGGEGHNEQSLNLATVVASIPVIIYSCWTQFAVMVKRCHDRGKSGWWCLLILIPIIGLVWAIVDLGILKGESATNSYGPAPA